MKFRFFLSLALATVTGTLWLGLTPRTTLAAESRQVAVSFQSYKLEEENAEGPDVVRTYFTVGDRRMVFGVPKGCRLVTGDEFVLIPTDPGLEGEIHVRRSPFPPSLDLADNAAAYRDAVTKQVPQGVKDAEIQPPLTNPYPFNGWQSLGFVYTYTFYGRSLRRTVSYLNLDEGVQVMITTEGSPTSAEKIEKMARSFIGSWWVMKPVSGK